MKRVDDFFFRENKMATFRELSDNNGAENGRLGIRTRPEQDPDGIVYEILDWDNFEALCVEVRSQIENGGEEFDLMLVVLKGGRSLGDEINGLPVDTVRVKRFHGVEVGSEPEILKWPDTPLEELVEMKVLVVEDVLDERVTLKHLFSEVLPRDGNKIAALHQKDEDENNPAEPRADYLGRQLPVVWVHYPWEDAEFVVEKLGKAWNKDGRTAEENLRILLGLGFAQERVREVIFSAGEELMEAFAQAELDYDEEMVDGWREAFERVVGELVASD